MLLSSAVAVLAGRNVRACCKCCLHCCLVGWVQTAKLGIQTCMQSSHQRGDIPTAIQGAVVRWSGLLAAAGHGLEPCIFNYQGSTTLVLSKACALCSATAHTNCDHAKGTCIALVRTQTLTQLRSLCHAPPNQHSLCMPSNPHTPPCVNF